MKPILTLLALSAAIWTSVQDPGQKLSAKEVFQLAEPSIVKIDVETAAEKGDGTGFFFKKQNLVATCYHVIENATKIKVSSGQLEWTVEAVYFDKKSDSAILVLKEGTGGKPLPLADPAKISPGEDIFVVGHALGLTKSITQGIISAKRDADGLHVMQISAPASPGSSGSPVLTASGTVAGMVSFTLTEGQNVNMAVRVEALVALLKEDPVPVGVFTAGKGGKAAPTGAADFNVPPTKDAAASKAVTKSFATVFSKIGVDLIKWDIYTGKGSLGTDVMSLKASERFASRLVEKNDIDILHRALTDANLFRPDEVTAMLVSLKDVQKFARLRHGAERGLRGTMIRQSKDEVVAESVGKWRLAVGELEESLYDCLDALYRLGCLDPATFRDTLPGPVYAYFFAPRLVNAWPDPDNNGCFIAHAASGSKLKPGDEITAIKLKTERLPTPVKSWAEVATFLIFNEKKADEVMLYVKRKGEEWMVSSKLVSY